MTRKMMIGLGLGAVVIAAGAAWAQGGGRRFMMKQMIAKHVAEAEDLIQATPRQRAQIDQSRDAILGALEARHQGRQMHQQLVALLTGDKLTEADLYQLANQRVDEIQALAKAIVPEIVKVHDVLTPAQRQKLADKAKEMRQTHQQHQGGFGGPGD
jgi:Spy/CpxP family protein refolding chaperone